MSANPSPGREREMSDQKADKGNKVAALSEVASSVQLLTKPEHWATVKKTRTPNRTFRPLGAIAFCI